MTEKKGIRGYLLNLPTHHIYVILLIAAALPLFVPLEIKPAIATYVQGFYNKVEALPRGSVVCIMSAGSAAFHYPDLEAPTRAVLHHLFSRGIKVIVASFSADNTIINTKTLAYILGGPPGQETNFPVTYGVDYVNLGFVGSGDTAKRAYLIRPVTSMPKDNYGNPVKDMPIYKGITSANNFALAIIHDSAEAHGTQRQLSGFSMPIAAIMTGGITGEALPYLAAGAWVGYVPGAPGAAQYETLTNWYNIGTTFGAAVSSTHLVLLGLLVLGNYAYFMLKRQAGGKK